MTNKANDVGRSHSSDLVPRHKILSISFDPADAEWVDGLVDLLRQAVKGAQIGFAVVRAVGTGGSQTAEA